jgi:hypothetical protein
MKYKCLELFYKIYILKYIHKIYMKISKLMKNKSGPCILIWVLVAVLLAASFGYIFFKFKEGMATCTDNGDGTTTCVENGTTFFLNNNKGTYQQKTTNTSSGMTSSADQVCTLQPNGETYCVSGCTTIVYDVNGNYKETINTCLKSCDLATSCDQCLGATINGTSSKCYWSDKKKETIKGKDDRCSAFQDNDHTRVPCDQRESNPQPSPSPNPNPSPWPHPDINPVRPDPDDHDDHHNWPNPKPGPKPGPNPNPEPEPAPSNCPSLTMLKGPVFINSSALPLY